MMARLGAILLAGLFLVGSVFPQRFPERPPTYQIKIIGEVVASDTFSPTYYVDSRPPDKFFLVQITSLIRGDELERIIFVLNRPSKRKYPFLRFVSEGKYRF